MENHEELDLFWPGEVYDYSTVVIPSPTVHDLGLPRICTQIRPEPMHVILPLGLALLLGTLSLGGCAKGAKSTDADKMMLGTQSGTTVCGNGMLEPGEQCDGRLLGGENCSTLGLGVGDLACDPVMCIFTMEMCNSGVAADAAGSAG